MPKEVSLVPEEVHFRILADAVPQVIWSNEADGKANYFNRRWYEYTGLTYEESVGPGWQVVVHSDDAPASKQKWQQCLANGQIFDTEYRLRRYDGVYRVDAVLNPALGKRRLGLFGMQERARLAGGTLDIESASGEGTTVYLHIPVQAP